MSNIRSQNGILLILVGIFLLFVSSFQLFAQKNHLQLNTEENSIQEQEQSNKMKDLSKKQKLSMLFQMGSESYEKGLYEEAEQYFLQALQVSPQNVAVLTNLGLIKYQKKEKGYAVAFWRKSIAIDPHFETAQQALSHSLKELSPLPSTQVYFHWEKFRKSFLVQIPFSFYMSCCLITFLLAMMLLISYWSQRRRAKLKYSMPSPFPLKILFLFFVAFVSFSLASMQTLDQLQTRATIIEERVPAHLAPSLQQPELFFLFAGGEVLVKKNTENWVQVQSSQGMVGWVPRKALFYTSGSSIW